MLASVQKNFYEEDVADIIEKAYSIPKELFDIPTEDFSDLEVHDAEEVEIQELIANAKVVFCIPKCSCVSGIVCICIGT